MPVILSAAVASIFMLFATASHADQASDTEYVWDLGEIFPGTEAWNTARERVLSDLEKIEARRGTLGKSAESLYDTLQLISSTSRDAYRVYAYSSLAGDEDLRNTGTQERNQLGDIMLARFSQATAWVQPEILSIGEELINAYLKEEPRLDPFRFQLKNTLRNAPHTLGEEAEQTLAYLSQTFSSPSNIYSLVANSDIPWPEVTLSDGETHVIDSQGYGRWRSSENRNDRKLVFDTFWTKWGEYSSSVGAILNTHIQTQAALAQARH
ncbi:MAG: oligoendopeptidase F, partial [Halioglobus sp.]|nr:oligoendopeptidase F [Halioglobus sp.]